MAGGTRRSDRNPAGPVTGSWLIFPVSLMLPGVLFLWSFWPYLSSPPIRENLSVLLWSVENHGNPLAAWFKTRPNDLAQCSPIVLFLSSLALPAADPWVLTAARLNEAILCLFAVLYTAVVGRVSGRLAGFIAGALLISAILPLRPLSSCVWQQTFLTAAAVQIALAALYAWLTENKSRIPMWFLAGAILMPASTSTWLGAACAACAAFLPFILKQPAPSVRRIANWGLYAAASLIALLYAIDPWWGAKLNAAPGPEIPFSLHEHGRLMISALTAGLGLPALAVFSIAAVLHERRASSALWLSAPLAWIVFQYAPLSPLVTAASAFVLLAILVWVHGANHLRPAWFVACILAAPTIIAGGPSHNLVYVCMAVCWILGVRLSETVRLTPRLPALKEALLGGHTKMEPARAAFGCAAIVTLALGLSNLAGAADAERRYFDRWLAPLQRDLHAAAHRAVADCLCVSDGKVLAKSTELPNDIDRLVAAALQRGCGWGVLKSKSFPPGWISLEEATGERYFPWPPAHHLALAIQPSALPYNSSLAAIVLADLDRGYSLGESAGDRVRRWKAEQILRTTIAGNPRIDPFTLLVKNPGSYQTLICDPADVEGDWGPGLVYATRSDGKIARNGMGRLVAFRDMETHITHPKPFPAPPRELNSRDYLTFWWYASDWRLVEVQRVGLRLSGTRCLVWSYYHKAIERMFEYPCEGWRFVMLPADPAEAFDLDATQYDDEWLDDIGAFGISFRHRHEDADESEYAEVAVDDVALHLFSEGAANQLQR